MTVLSFRFGLWNMARLVGYLAVACALAVQPAQAQARFLECKITTGMAPRDWVIRVTDDAATPVGFYYERIQKSTSRVQYLSYRVTSDVIDIAVRDGNAGEQFTINLLSGSFKFERMTDLDHSGTERILQIGIGSCTAQPQVLKPN